MYAKSHMSVVDIWWEKKVRETWEIMEMLGFHLKFKKSCETALHGLYRMKGALILAVAPL